MEFTNTGLYSFQKELKKTEQSLAKRLKSIEKDAQFLASIFPYLILCSPFFVCAPSHIELFRSVAARGQPAMRPLVSKALRLDMLLQGSETDSFSSAICLNLVYFVFR
jgi:hypothetical protein